MSAYVRMTSELCVYEVFSAHLLEVCVCVCVCVCVRAHLLEVLLSEEGGGGLETLLGHGDDLLQRVLQDGGRPVPLV